jgi:hypothetical protein
LVYERVNKVREARLAMKDAGAIKLMVIFWLINYMRQLWMKISQR